MCTPREEERRRAEEEQRQERWRQLSKSLVNLRVASSKGNLRQNEEEDDDELWKGVWRSGKEAEKSVWSCGGGEGGDGESCVSHWTSKPGQSQRNKVCFQ